MITSGQKLELLSSAGGKYNTVPTKPVQFFPQWAQHSCQKCELNLPISTPAAFPVLGAVNTDLQLTAVQVHPLTTNPASEAMKPSVLASKPCLLQSCRCSIPISVCRCTYTCTYTYAVLYWSPAYDLGTFLMCSVTYHPGWESGEEEGRI